MIFTRFKGDPEGRPLTHGKIYIARPWSRNETVGYEFLSIDDDLGNSYKVESESKDFEYLSEVYAIALVAFDEFCKGGVAILDDISPDGKFYSVKAVGYRCTGDLLLIDSMSVTPGIHALHVPTGEWVKIAKTDECMWMAESGGKTRCPTEYRFIVDDGDLVIEPYAECVFDDGEPELTKGLQYRLLRVTDDGLVVVTNDIGAETAHMASRFKLWEES